MKTLNLFTLVFCLVLFSCNTNVIQPGEHHICEDNTHQQCDGFCECDGIKCGDYPSPFTGYNSLTIIK